MSYKASLVLVGTGIKFLSHLTTEAITYIKQSDQVLYLVNDPAMKAWIRANNANCESLDNLYDMYNLRIDCYRAITARILEAVEKLQHVCVVFYGHPSLFSQSGLDAVIEAKNKGYDARILPAISAEDCLLADLLIDTGLAGVQSFEASDLLLHQRKFDTNCHLILWQVDAIGNLGHDKDIDNKQIIKILSSYLSEFYDRDHEVFLYEAAQYPSFDPLIQKINIANLHDGNFSPITSLYVPPMYQSYYDKEMAKKLGINLEELEK
jgi:uncharacterized protein YabN with tetrapyrrole methylase and pyrophosphatase domain